ncbi:MAG TPA: hypothetical protein VFP36_15430 [Usitatibacter sp.]|nr:hypothetical protein [Usitatibacter sp.]
MKRNILGRTAGALVAGAVFSLVTPGSALATQNTNPPWLWLTASLTDCTFTITPTWAGYPEAKYVEVFVTEGYTGTAILPTDVRIKNKDATITVTMPALATSATATYFYPWAQLLDMHGNAIPSSLDFSGQLLAYCAAP